MELSLRWRRARQRAVLPVLWAWRQGPLWERLSPDWPAKAAAERIEPMVEDAYWRENYGTRPYVDKIAAYDEYQLAYRYGWEACTRYPDRTFDQVELEPGPNWQSRRGTSSLDWERSKAAARDAWHRVERALTGDADGDGR